MTPIQQIQLDINKKSNLLKIQVLKFTWDEYLQFINRLTMFIVFFWFGFLKIISHSPAEQLVSDLHKVTIAPLINQQHFIMFLGIFECVIGIAWLFPRLTKIAFVLFAIQIITTFLPFVFISDEIVKNGFELSLTGQYIVKNLVLISCALNILFLNTYKRK